MYNFNHLKNLIRQLRAPNGCPWDKEQTEESLVPQLLEEVYELVDAIFEKSKEKIKEELGDVLLHIVFQIIIAEEKKSFSEQDVFKEIIEKIIRRHPHVFGDLKTDDIKIINENWEKIKKQEKGKKERTILDGIPKNLPALLRAYKITKKVAKIGFDWADISNVFEKIREEWNELEQAVVSNNHKKIEEEFGDVLFMLVNLSRFLNINPEQALMKTNKKFEKRFSYIESNIDINSASLEEMDNLWEKAKKFEKM